jgi:hypothetical protein
MTLTAQNSVVPAALIIAALEDSLEEGLGRIEARLAAIEAALADRDPDGLADAISAQLAPQLDAGRRAIRTAARRLK